MTKTIAIAAAALSGCINTANPQPTPQNPPASVKYLCVGMETSKRFGSCPGCQKDAERMAYLMSKDFGYAGDTLISGQATKEAVVSKLKAGIEATPEDGLFLFFYSGHGGQERLGGAEPTGADKDDEYLCLYDTHMLDDEIWSIVSKCKGRVFLYFDACHSATMYRSVASELKIGGFKPGDNQVTLSMNPDGTLAMAMSANDLVKSRGFTFSPDKFAKATAKGTDNAPSPRILCWSGCAESEYSYGSNSGGTLTNGVLAYWKKGRSYDDVWKDACAYVKRCQPTQNPVSSYVGGFPKGLEAFK